VRPEFKRARVEIIEIRADGVGTRLQEKLNGRINGDGDGAFRRALSEDSDVIALLDDAIAPVDRWADEDAGDVGGRTLGNTDWKRKKTGTIPSESSL